MLAFRRALVMVLAAVPLTWSLAADYGIVWPDEIYQSLEPAHRFAFGYGIVAWEFQEGARSWLFPGLLGLVMKAASAIGVTSGRGIVLLTRLPIAALSLAGVYASMRLAQKARGGVGGELIAGVLVALFPVLVVFEHRALSETVAAPAVVLAAWWTWRSSARGLVAAGLVVGLASFARFQVGLVALGLFVVLLADPDRRTALRFGAGLTIAGVIGAGLDWITWGRPFASLYRYLEFNLFSDGASKFGVEPPYFYFVALWTAAGPAMLFVAYGLWTIARSGESRVRALLIVVAVFVLAHLAIGHKELRFLLPILPLTLALAGAGMGRVLERLPRGQLWLLLVALYLAGLMAYQNVTLTFAELGQWRGRTIGRARTWRFLASANEALFEVGRKDDVCGVAVIVPRGWGWTGGFTYLHRDVPMFFGPRLRPDQQAAANYVVRPTDPGRPYGEYEVVRVLERCAPPPSDYTRRPPR